MLWNSITKVRDAILKYNDRLWFVMQTQHRSVEPSFSIWLVRKTCSDSLQGEHLILRVIPTQSLYPTTSILYSRDTGFQNSLRKTPWSTSRTYRGSALYPSFKGRTCHVCAHSQSQSSSSGSQGVYILFGYNVHTSVSQCRIELVEKRKSSRRSLDGAL